MIMRGSLERLAPVLMTALTAGIDLVPPVLGGQQPGKEILYPVAKVILGGLITSTICEYVVHPASSGGSAAEQPNGRRCDQWNEVPVTAPPLGEVTHACSSIVPANMK